MSEELPEGYQFLSEEEINALLNLRIGKEEDSEEVALRLEKAGFVDWSLAENGEEELTERLLNEQIYRGR